MRAKRERGRVSVIIGIILGLLLVVAIGVFLVARTFLARMDQFTSEMRESMETATGQGKIAELYKAAAETSPFVEPEDGVFAEDRLLVMLAVRNRVTAVYTASEAAFDPWTNNPDGPKPSPGKSPFEILGTPFEAMAEVKMAHAQALVDEQMSLEEYQFIARSTYLAWLRCALEEDDVVADEKAFRSITSVIIRWRTTSLNAPPENVELFRKHLPAIAESVHERLDRSLLGGPMEQMGFPQPQFPAPDAIESMPQDG